jgi:hypothetical protein
MDKSDALNDQVVRVTAGRKFREIADEWEFNADNFLPYAPVTLERLMALVQEVELPETKMALLNTISIIVERLEHNVSKRRHISHFNTNEPRSPPTPTPSLPFSHPSGLNPATNIS